MSPNGLVEAPKMARLLFAAVAAAATLPLSASAAAAGSAAAAATAAAANPLLMPSYLAPGAHIPELLATLAATGLANRDQATVWLNSSATSWRNGVPVMWSYPQADTIWLPYLKTTKGLQFTVAPDAKLCTLLAHPRVAAAVKGRVMYGTSRGAGALNALQYAAVSAAGINDGVPVTAAMLAKHSCLAQLPVLLTIPAASTFADDLAVYAWMAKTLMPLSSTKVLVGACDNWANYTCGWGDPLGTASIDFAVQQKSMVINLSPDTSKHPDQAAMFAVFAAHMGPLGAFSGWAEPESDMVALLSKKDGVVVCGAPNLSFLSSLAVTTAKLPHHRSTATLDTTKIYLSFQSNEGDTPKNAYSFRGGNWLLDSRGSVPMAWGSAPVIAELFPGLWCVAHFCHAVAQRTTAHLPC